MSDLDRLLAPIYRMNPHLPRPGTCEPRSRPTRPAVDTTRRGFASFEDEYCPGDIGEFEICPRCGELSLVQRGKTGCCGEEIEIHDTEDME